jgi:hypothetical protein
MDTMQTQGIENWAARLHGEALLDIFSPDEIIYLSPDAEDVLFSIDSSKVDFERCNRTDE